MGPRLKLRLYKIEEGLLKGNVIYNRVVERNSE
jgi:ribosome biogenesis protein SSF1/2